MELGGDGRSYFLNGPLKSDELKQLEATISTTIKSNAFNIIEFIVLTQ